MAWDARTGGGTATRSHAVLEKAILDYTDSVAGGVRHEGLYAYDYGVRGDGVTNSASALQGCIDAAKAAGAGAVWLPYAPTSGSKQIMLGSQIWVPDSIRLVGPGRRACTLQAIPGTFPTNTPVIRLGNPNIVPPQPNDVAFDARLENLAVHSSAITGSICVQMHGIQEGAGLEHVGCYGWKNTAVQVQSSQNFRLYDLELYGETGSTSGIDITGSGPCTVEWVTTNPDNVGAGYGIKLNGNPQVVLRQIHIEGAKYGIWSNSGSTVVIGALGSVSTDILMYFDPNNNSGICIGLSANASRVTLQDDWSGYTLLSSTNNDLAFYAQREAQLGVGLTSPASRPAGFYQGTLKTYRSTTGNRQSASALGAGAQAFDSTLNKPIWSDGTNWRDASGAVV